MPPRKYLQGERRSIEMVTTAKQLYLQAEAVRDTKRAHWCQMRLPIADCQKLVERRLVLAMYTKLGVYDRYSNCGQKCVGRQDTKDWSLEETADKRTIEKRACFSESTERVGPASAARPSEKKEKVKMKKGQGKEDNATANVKKERGGPSLIYA